MDSQKLEVTESDEVELPSCAALRERLSPEPTLSRKKESSTLPRPPMDPPGSPHPLRRRYYRENHPARAPATHRPGSQKAPRPAPQPRPAQPCRPSKSQEGARRFQSDRRGTVEPRP